MIHIEGYVPGRYGENNTPERATCDIEIKPFCNIANTVSMHIASTEQLENSAINFYLFFSRSALLALMSGIALELAKAEVNLTDDEESEDDEENETPTK